LTAAQPRTAGNTVRTYVSRLRRQVDSIESIGEGYVLRLGSAVLDLAVFEQRLSAARAARQGHDDVRGARLLQADRRLMDTAAGRPTGRCLAVMAGGRI
jgi:DNA-binding SARP family transcriptional activator